MAGGFGNDTPHLPTPAPIDAYGNGGFRFGGMSHRGSIICFPDGMWAWPVASVRDLNADTLAQAFARGEAIQVGTDSKRTLQLTRPLDFAAVTDHSEQLGALRACLEPGPSFESPGCRAIRREGYPQRVRLFARGVLRRPGRPPSRPPYCGPDAVRCLEAARRAWKDTRDAAEEDAGDSAEAPDAAGDDAGDVAGDDGAKEPGEAEGATVIEHPLNIAPPDSLTPPPEPEAIAPTPEPAAAAADGNGSKQRA